MVPTEAEPTHTLGPPTPPPSPISSPTQSSPTPTACPPDLCTYAAQFFLSRPIAPSNHDQVDPTYRFGSTQGEQREPHHGVEFLNPYGTPVLAAADGLVVVAGEDNEPTSEQGVWPITFYGPFSHFYGQLVVIEHQLPLALLDAFPEMPQPLYTLYAHLSQVSVGVGQRVETGQEVGLVGQAGVAEGPHLHFEVRLGENNYSSVRNPELWLAPHEGDDGLLNGALAGRILNSNAVNLGEKVIVLEHLPEGPDGPSGLDVKVLTYEEKDLIGLPPWEESFAVGDIPPGWYRISFPHFGLQKFLVQVFPGQLTMVTLQVE